MSAFVCDDKFFKILGIFAASRSGNLDKKVNPQYFDRFTEEQKQLRGTRLEELYANILLSENIRSVEARYPDSKESLPGPVPMIYEIKMGNESSLAAYHVKAVQILKMCDCLEYQSCETEDYRETVAFELLNKIRKAAIRSLPGYEEAAWG